MFGPDSIEELIFKKTKLWWELLHKVHLPDQREKFNDDELVLLAKNMQELEILVRNLEIQNDTPLGKMVDFQKLRNFFFNKYKYSYGEPIRTKRKKFDISSESDSASDA